MADPVHIHELLDLAPPSNLCRPPKRSSTSAAPGRFKGFDARWRNEDSLGAVLKAPAPAASKSIRAVFPEPRAPIRTRCSGSIPAIFSAIRDWSVTATSVQTVRRLHGTRKRWLKRLLSRHENRLFHHALLAAGQPIQTRSPCTADVALNALRAGTPGRLGANGFMFESSPSPATLRHDGW